MGFWKWFMRKMFPWALLGLIVIILVVSMVLAGRFPQFSCIICAGGFLLGLILFAYGQYKQDRWLFDSIKPSSGSNEDKPHIPEKRGSDGMNVTERKLFEALKRIGLDPIPQYGVGQCTIDFAFPENYWAFEVNGPEHNTPEGRERDKRRWQFLTHTDPPWKVKNFSAKRVYYHPDQVAREIKRILEEYPEGGRDNSTW